MNKEITDIITKIKNDFNCKSVIYNEMYNLLYVRFVFLPLVRFARFIMDNNLHISNTTADNGDIVVCISFD